MPPLFDAGLEHFEELFQLVCRIHAKTTVLEEYSTVGTQHILHHLGGLVIPEVRLIPRSLVDFAANIHEFVNGPVIRNLNAERIGQCLVVNQRWSVRSVHHSVRDTILLTGGNDVVIDVGHVDCAVLNELSHVIQQVVLDELVQVAVVHLHDVRKGTACCFGRQTLEVIAVLRVLAVDGDTIVLLGKHVIDFGSAVVTLLIAPPRNGQRIGGAVETTRAH